MTSYLPHLHTLAMAPNPWHSNRIFTANILTLCLIRMSKRHRACTIYTIAFPTSSMLNLQPLRGSQSTDMQIRHNLTNLLQPRQNSLISTHKAQRMVLDTAPLRKRLHEL